MEGVCMNEQWLEHLPLKDIKEISPVSGGDVNEAYRVETDTDTFFLLVQRGRKESFYAAEIAGLMNLNVQVSRHLE